MLWTLSKPILRHYIIPRYYVKFNRKTRSQQRKRDLAAENRHRKGVKASVKYKVIYRHREKYSIREMCRFFEVSRSGYYDYIRRMDIPAKELPLAEKIRVCQALCRNTYGYSSGTKYQAGIGYRPRCKGKRKGHRRAATPQ